jgi:hypothetical protein
MIDAIGPQVLPSLVIISRVLAAAAVLVVAVAVAAVVITHTKGQAYQRREVRDYARAALLNGRRLGFLSHMSKGRSAKHIRKSSNRSPVLLAACAITTSAVIVLSTFLAIQLRSKAQTVNLPHGKIVAVVDKGQQISIFVASRSRSLTEVKIRKNDDARAETTLNFPPPDPGTAQSIAYSMMSKFGFNQSSQWRCLDDAWQRLSGWVYDAENASGAYGIPQALPGSRMTSAGSDWETDPATQVKWGLGYIKSVYGTPCAAWDHIKADGWY